MNAPFEMKPAVLARPMPAQMLDALKTRFGDRLSLAQSVREQHGRDESPFEVAPPEAVVFAEATEDVAFVVALAARHAVPVIAFGVGSSLEGHLLAVQGGVSVDLSRMNRVLRLNAEDLNVTVQPGVTRNQLNREIKDSGLFFPIDPGADASIGGMSATRASGTNAVRYGTMRENVLALEVVTASGEIIRTGTRARKSSAGYDLTRLFVGSEGTLGVMTEITVKLHPLPEAISAAVCHFADIGAAVATTIQLIQMGVPIARCELLDANAVRAVNAHDRLSLRETPLLLMEFHGSPAGVKEQAETWCRYSRRAVRFCPKSRSHEPRSRSPANARQASQRQCRAQPYPQHRSRSGSRCRGWRRAAVPAFQAPPPDTKRPARRRVRPASGQSPRPATCHSPDP